MATAYRLQAAGLSVKVFEGNSHPGGKMDSVVKNGFQFETGPILIPNTYSSLLSLLEDLGLGDKLHAIEGPMAIVKDGQVKRLRIPHMGMDLIRSGLLGWKSLLSLTRLAIPLLKNRKALGYADLSDAAHLDTQSVRQFCDRGITDEAYENLLDTALRATYMHSADEASIVE